jgi:hypothetical protein
VGIVEKVGGEVKAGLILHRALHIMELEYFASRMLTSSPNRIA